MRAAFLHAPYGPARARFHLRAEFEQVVRPVRGAWVIVTAWNPYGRQVSRVENEQAPQQLISLVSETHFFTPVVNGEGTWQEPALLVEEARLKDAVLWLQGFDQAAVLFGVGRRAALVWRDGHIERFWAVRA